MCKTKKTEVVILLTNTGTLLSKVIQRYTNEPYTHVSIGFDIELNQIYSFGRIFPQNPLIGGFIVENRYEGLYSIFTNVNCAVYTLRVDKLQYEKMKEIINTFHNNKNKYKYNFIGLFAVAFNIPFKRENAYFCSQFAATVLEKSNVKIFNKKCELITPSDFRTSKHLKLVYSGRLSDYSSNFTSISNTELLPLI
ncbi:hypothetical protein [Haloimpatiens massiliensis]|uniref:hypothetical protein n=1 Tax=Haloimpatiens massiliensis TaxID=1658110 RepID=UPI001A9A5E84|nr:hypothetical protein [Haloimpatiens massiliensis]